MSLNPFTDQPELPDFANETKFVPSSVFEPEKQSPSHGRRRAAEIPANWGVLSFLHPVCNLYTRAMPKKGWVRRSIVGAAAAGIVLGAGGGVYAMTLHNTATPQYAAQAVSLSGSSEVTYHAPIQIPVPENATPTDPTYVDPLTLGTPTLAGGGTVTVDANGNPISGGIVDGTNLQAEGQFGLIFPTKSHTITSPFGSRFHPVLHTYKMHDGTDFGAACGDPVYASEEGTVELAHYRGASGNAIEINHGDLNGDKSGSVFRTHYFHLSAYGVHEGDHVVKGQFIGLVGSTGRSTGCHMHFGVSIDGQYIDPMSVLGKDASQAEYGTVGSTYSPTVPADEESKQKEEAVNEGAVEGATGAGNTGNAGEVKPSESAKPADPAPAEPVEQPSDPATPVETPSEQPSEHIETPSEGATEGATETPSPTPTDETIAPSDGGTN